MEKRERSGDAIELGYGRQWDIRGAGGRTEKKVGAVGMGSECGSTGGVGGLGVGVVVGEECAEDNDILREPIPPGSKRTGIVARRENGGDGGVLGSGQQIHDLALSVGRSDADDCGGNGRSVVSVLVAGWAVNRIFCAGKIETDGHRGKVDADDLRGGEWTRRHME